MEGGTVLAVDTKELVLRGWIQECELISVRYLHSYERTCLKSGYKKSELNRYGTYGRSERTYLKGGYKNCELGSVRYLHSIKRPI